ncbi:MAG TPA: glutathione S-transferase family protein [Steroidobacteraceae bacterium]|jgi:glutathione S-transferase
MLKIYGAPISVHTRKAIVVANLKGLSHEVVPVVPVLPSTLPSNWRSLSPAGLIPALLEDQVSLADSTAICMYLDRAHPQPAVYPTDPRRLAQVLSLEAYAGDRLFRTVVRVLFNETVIGPKMKQQPTNSAAVAETLHTALPDAFGFLNQSAERDYLVGDALSMADIAVVSNLMNFQYCGFEIDRTRYRRVAALFDRVLAEHAFQKALEAERTFADSLGLDTKFLARRAA